MTRVRRAGDRDVVRVRRLALAALAVTLVQVAWGAFTRGSGSGYGCQDRWPLCEGGLLEIGDAGGLLPRPEFGMVVEWLHRWIALVVGVLLVWLAVAAWRRLPGVRRVTVPVTAAVLIVLAQSLVGAAVVIYDLRADLVTAHLLGAMVLLGVLAYATVNSFVLDGPDTSARGRPPAQAEERGEGGSRAEERWERLLAVGALLTLVTILLGAAVHDRYVGGWPLVGGDLLPGGLGDSVLVTVHWAHRVSAGLGLAWAGWLAWAAVRRGRPDAEVRLVHTALALVLVNVGLGAVHVFTQVSSTIAIVAHLGVGAGAWTAGVAAWTLARRHHRGPVGLGQGRDPEPVMARSP